MRKVNLEILCSAVSIFVEYQQVNLSKQKNDITSIVFYLIIENRTNWIYFQVKFMIN